MIMIIYSQKSLPPNISAGSVAKFIGKMKKKYGIMKSGLDAMPLFLLDDLLYIFLVFSVLPNYQTLFQKEVPLELFRTVTTFEII